MLEKHSEGGKFRIGGAMELHPETWKVVYCIITLENGSKVTKTDPKVFKLLEGYKEIRAQCITAKKGHLKWRKHRRREAGRWYLSQPNFQECDNEVIEKHIPPTHEKLIFRLYGLCKDFEKFECSLQGLMLISRIALSYAAMFRDMFTWCGQSPPMVPCER
jgi:hypothetical protein